MALYAIGDIHGCWTALETVLGCVSFGKHDQIVALGDYVDRGPNSRRVVEWVMDRTMHGECIPLRGNHEIMMLESLKGRMPLHAWLGFGGQEALNSYSPDGRPGLPEDVPLDHLRFLDHQLLSGYETATHYFVHASMRPHLPLSRQPAETLYWERFESLQPHHSGKMVICGHTAQKSGVPLYLGYGICLDTWAYGDGWLTCMNVETGDYWQANQQRETRSGNIESCRSHEAYQ